LGGGGWSTFRIFAVKIFVKKYKKSVQWICFREAFKFSLKSENKFSNIQILKKTIGFVLRIFSKYLDERK